METRQVLLAGLLVLPGVVGVTVFGDFARVDWEALQQAYPVYLEAVRQSASLERLFLTHAQQNVHRINLFADGVWTLLSAILAAIGLHGLLAR